MEEALNGRLPTSVLAELQNPTRVVRSPLRYSVSADKVALLRVLSYSIVVTIYVTVFVIYLETTGMLLRGDIS